MLPVFHVLTKEMQTLNIVFHTHLHPTYFMGFKGTMNNLLFYSSIIAVELLQISFCTETSLHQLCFPLGLTLLSLERKQILLK